MATASAFVLLGVEMDSKEEVLRSLKRVDGVVEAIAVYGVFDIVSKLDAESLDKIKIATERMKHIDKVRSTLTLVINQEQKQHYPRQPIFK